MVYGLYCTAHAVSKENGVFPSDVYTPPFYRSIYLVLAKNQNNSLCKVDCHLLIYPPTFYDGFYLHKMDWSECDVAFVYSSPTRKQQVYLLSDDLQALVIST